MSDGLERRICRLEKRVEEKFKTPGRCNCRVVTRFHNAFCLDTILKQACRVCPVHDFREFGFFFWSPSQYPVGGEDTRFCPCPPHPWRTFLTGPHPLSWEQHKAALEAWSNHPPRNNFDLNEDNCQTSALLAEYGEAREQWLATNGRQLPSKEELVELEWKRAR
jgi:hypothetical protein